MAGPSSNPYAGNRHADVMGEAPTDEAARARLVEEVKNRAKGAFQQKDMPSAEMLYGKAIELLEATPEKKEFALYSNRAMARLNLNKVEGALADANACIKLNPEFAKAYHRKAQALVRLSQWDEAIEAAEAGAKLEPSNSAFPELITKANADKEKDLKDKERLRSDAQDATVVLHNASTARTAQPVAKTPKTEGGEDLSLRGYKKTADGKTTSYFHTDISDEAKELIAKQGFGKPQKIEGVVEEKNDNGDLGSTWNKAGTYEEKNMIKWIEERMKEALVGITFEIPSGACLKTTGVESISGDASISMSRGKRRHLLELEFKVAFEAKAGSDVGTGHLKYTEVTVDDDDFEVVMESGAGTAPAVMDVLTSFAKSAGQGLQPLVSTAVKKLVEEYKAK